MDRLKQINSNLIVAVKLYVIERVKRLLSYMVILMAVELRPLTWQKE